MPVTPVTLILARRHTRRPQAPPTTKMFTTTAETIPSPARMPSSLDKFVTIVYERLQQSLVEQIPQRRDDAHAPYA